MLAGPLVLELGVAERNFKVPRTEVSDKRAFQQSPRLEAGACLARDYVYVHFLDSSLL